MLSLLRVIDNPNQDIPLLAVLMSPLYGFTADDVARLRLESRDVSVLRLPAAGGGEPAPLRPGGPGAGPVPGRGGHHALRRLFKLPLHQNRLPGHGPGHGGRPPAPGQPAPAGEVCPGLRVLRLPRGVGVCAVFGQAAGQRLGFAGGGALPPGQGRRDGDEHPQVQGAGVPRVHCGGLWPQLCLGPAGGGAAPPRAGPGGQAAGPGALGPVYHHRPGGHRPGDSPCLRRGGAARPLRGADPRQGEAAAGGLLGGPGAHRGKAGLRAHRGRACPLHRAPGQKRRPVAAAVRPVPPRRRGPAPGCRGPGGLRLLAGLHPLGHPLQPVPARGRRLFPRKPPRPSHQTGSCTAACGSRLPLPTPTRRRWASRPRWRPPSWRRSRTAAGTSPSPGPPGWGSRA